MKNLFFTILISFSLLSAGLVSCSNGDSTPRVTAPSGTYKLVLNNNTVAEGASNNKVMMLDNTVNLGGTDSDFVITITNVPESIGGVVIIGSGDKSSLSISGKNILESGVDETYWAASGTVTRISASKITFEVTCRPDATNTRHLFNGSVESDSFQVK